MKTEVLIQQVTTATIAVVVILGTFAIVGYQVVNHQPVAVPDVIALLVGGVSGAYLGHASASSAVSSVSGAVTEAIANGAAKAAALASTLPPPAPPAPPAAA